MQYLIMLLVVIGLAAADFLTGLIKGYATGTISSKIMRKGGLNKLCEIIVMASSCGLEIGITELGKYYHNPKLAEIAGNFTAIAVFCYIILMEIVSLLENYSEINPDAGWAISLIKKLKVHNERKDENAIDKKK